MKKSYLKPFPQNYNTIPLKHRQEQFDATLKLSNLCKGLSKPCGFLKLLNTSQSGTSTVEQLPFKVPLQSSLVQGNCGSMSNKLQQNLFYRAIDKVDELNNILKVPKNPIGGTC